MKMANLPIKVAFPVFKYVAEVEHFTPRTPTAIERMILRLIHDYQNIPVIGSLSLLTVFEQQLGIANAIELVTPSIDDLMVLGVLERPQKQITEMSIAELRLSNDGKNFYQRNQLPGRSKRDSVEYLFDPLTQIWSAFKKAFSKPVPSDIKFDEESFRPGNPAEEIRIRVEQDRYEWKTPLTEIRNIKPPRIDGVQQNLQLFELQVNRDGTLFLEANDNNPALQQWLKQVQPIYIQKNVLDKILEIELNAWPPLNADSLNSAVITCLANSSTINQSIQKCFPEKSFFTIGLQSHPAFTKIGTADLILTVELSELIIWNNKSDNTSQATKSQWLAIKPQGLPDELLALIFPSFGEDPIAVSSGVANLYWAGQPVKGLVAIQHFSAIKPIWATIQHQLEKSTNTSYDPKVFALALLWKPPEVMMNEWLKLHANDAFEELLRFGAEFETLIRQIVGSKIEISRQWQQIFSAKLSERIALADPFDYLSLCNHINAVNDQLPSFKTQLHRELIAKALPIKTQNQFLEVRKLIGTKLEFPESFIESSLIANWVDGILSGKTIDLAGVYAWIEDLERCKKNYQELMRNIGQKALDLASTSEIIVAGSIKIKSLELANDWLQFSESIKNRSEYVYAQTNLKRLTEQVKHWKTLMDRYMLEPLPKDWQWLVFDTSALMDFPDILNRIGKLKNFKIALPLKVLDELDHHKHDKREESQDRAIIAQKIIKTIELLTDSITQINHIPELLPHEQIKEPSADDMIISAARSLAFSPVLLVSSDVNFRNKAKALELKVITTADFIKQFFSISHPSEEPVQEQNYPKKGKKENKK